MAQRYRDDINALNALLGELSMWSESETKRLRALCMWYGRKDLAFKINAAAASDIIGEVGYIIRQEQRQFVRVDVMERFREDVPGRLPKEKKTKSEKVPDILEE